MDVKRVRRSWRIRSIHDPWDNTLDKNEERLVKELLELSPKHMWAVYLEVLDRMPDKAKKVFTKIMNDFTSGLPEYEKKLNQVEKIIDDTLEAMEQDVLDAGFADDK